MNDLFAKHRHNTEIIKTVWQKLKKNRGGSCSYIRHNEKKEKKTNKQTNKSVHKHKINNEE